MSRIRIKCFGAIKGTYQGNDGWLDISKVTMFIGNQGSGKSTVAKLISTFTWIEKALVRGDYDKKWFERKNRLGQLIEYHRLENYLCRDTVIEYQGDAYYVAYQGGSLIIEEYAKSVYPLPQIMYVPAERNFIAYVKKTKELRLSSNSMKDFLTEFDKAKNDTKVLSLPINDVNVEYDKLNDTLNIKGKDYKVKLTEASSGFQSFVPLYLVSHYLSNSVKKQSENKEPMSDKEMDRFRKGVVNIWENDDLTDEQKRIAISVLASKFNKTAFINIVEEPEQNLFPSSQWQMLQSLLTFNNMNDGNKLIITTHSPYLINYLSIAIQGEYLKTKIFPNYGDLFSELSKVISEKSLISSDSVAVYQLDEKKGVVTKLSASMGIPSDRNYLNDMLREGNQMFDKLLEIEEKSQK